MSKVFEKVLKQAVNGGCDTIQLDNESFGFTIYLISSGSGFSLDLNKQEISEIFSFLRKVKLNKGKFEYLLDNTKIDLQLRFRQDFGEEVFTLKILAKK